jgi:hypothetical protein
LRRQRVRSRQIGHWLSMSSLYTRPRRGRQSRWGVVDRPRGEVPVDAWRSAWTPSQKPSSSRRSRRPAPVSSSIAATTWSEVSRSVSSASGCGCACGPTASGTGRPRRCSTSTAATAAQCRPGSCPATCQAPSPFTASRVPVRNAWCTPSAPG